MFIIYFNIYLYHINFANYFDNSDGGKIVLFLLKHSFKTKTLHLFVWRRNKSCYVFKVLLNYRLYITHVYEAATLNLLAERLFWVSFCFKKMLCVYKFTGKYSITALFHMFLWHFVDRISEDISFLWLYAIKCNLSLLDMAWKYPF